MLWTEVTKEAYKQRYKGLSNSYMDGYIDSIILTVSSTSTILTVALSHYVDGYFSDGCIMLGYTRELC